MATREFKSPEARLLMQQHDKLLQQWNGKKGDIAFQMRQLASKRLAQALAAEKRYRANPHLN